MKKLLLFLFIPLLVFLIYQFNKDTKVNVLNISDTENPYITFILDYYKNKNKLDNFNNNFSKSDYRITDLSLDIENNKFVNINQKKQYLNNSLIRSEIITISVGNTDLYYKLNYYDVNEMYNYIDELCQDYEKLLEKIRMITKEKIIVFGYTSINLKNKKVIDYYNEKLKMKCQKNNINFLDIDENTKNNLLNLLKSWKLDK